MSFFPNSELLRLALVRLKAWGASIQSQRRPHIWSILPLKAIGARPGAHVQYTERVDKDFFDTYLRVRDGKFPYFDPTDLRWLPELYYHSNTATARKGTFNGNWRAGTLSGSDYELAANYASIFSSKVLSKSNQINKIPAASLALWLFRAVPMDSPTIESYARYLRNAFEFSDDEWAEIFDDDSAGYGSMSGTTYFESTPLTQSETIALVSPLAKDRETLMPPPRAFPALPSSPSSAAAIRSLPSVSAEEIEAFAAGEGVMVDALLVARVRAALLNGHVRLIGPPGTGKSTIARAILKAYVGEDYVFATATAAWEQQEVIGGLSPNYSDNGSRLEFSPGIALQAADAGRWLCIDELNRANIDEAFGEFFSLLAGSDVELPYFVDETSKQRVKIFASRPSGILSPGTFGIPDSWRMIATMNSWDKLSLNRLSFAFTRRWCSIYVPVPTPEVYSEIIDRFAVESGLEEPRIVLGLEQIFSGEGRTVESLRDLDLALGPAIAKSCVKHCVAAREGGLSEVDAIGSAICGFVLPQFEGQHERHVAIKNALSVALQDSFDSSAGDVGAALAQIESELRIYTGYVD